MSWRKRLSAAYRFLAARATARLLGPRPMEGLVRGLGPVAAGPVPAETAEAISRRLATGRAGGPPDPWLHPAFARWLNHPGCRPYAWMLARELRAAGHAAQLVLGAGAGGAHAWVECRGRAFDLEHREGTDPGVLTARYPLATRVG